MTEAGSLLAGHKTEEWRPVVGFEGLYDVSNLGRVRSLLTHRGNVRTVPKLLQPRLHSRGYLRVHLAKNLAHHDKYIHVIVMEAFVGPCPDGMEVNHKDAVKSNNRLQNLEYATPLENIHHSIGMGLWKPEMCSVPGSRNGKAKLTEADIPAIRLMAETLPHHVVAERFGISRSVVQKIHARTAWKHVA